MRGLQWISTTEEIQQFVHLWSLISQVQLTKHPDEITWCFTMDGKYSSCSAYEVQFHRSYADYKWQRI
jgi:hypothetical protein